MLHPYFEMVEKSWWGTLVRESTWGFGLVEIVHLFGLVLLLGGVIVMSLRLLGLMMAKRPVTEISRAVNGITLTGLVTMLISGVSLWASAALRYYDSPPFWFKMGFLLAAIIFHFTLYRAVTRKDQVNRYLQGFTGVTALFLWFAVGVGGRVIGFF